MRIHLINRASPNERIVVENFPATIGRNELADITLDDRWIADCQCILDCADGKVRIWDLGVRTGTFVDGRRVQRAILKPGATLTLGGTDYLVWYEPTVETGTARRVCGESAEELPVAGDSEAVARRRALAVV
jgi:pSer/pThr/pTyr-binding forkhead associated (FHA) protein